MNPNSNVKYNESVNERIAFYATRFAGYSDEKLKETVEHERHVRGWGSERSYFLAALRSACEQRGIGYCW